MNHGSFLGTILRGICASLLILLSSLHAQLPDQATAAHRIDGETVIEWFAYQGRTYFIQVSDEADPLQKWVWAPVIEGGNEQNISYEFGGDAPRGFARLQYTDTAKPEGVSYEEWDIDRDGLSNQAEISGNPQTNPLKADTDGDGLPDGWELANGLNAVDDGSSGSSNGWNGDADGDGASNGTELEKQTKANNANSFPPGLWTVRNNIYAWSDTVSETLGTVQVTRLMMPWAGEDYAEQWEEAHLESDTVGQMFQDMPSFPATLAEAIVDGAAERTHNLSTENASIFTRSYDGHSRSGDFVETRNWIRVPLAASTRTFHFLKVTDVLTSISPGGQVFGHEVMAARKETLTVQANQTNSSHIDLLPVPPPSVDGFSKIATLSLIPLENAPEVLSVNSDFDEGRIDPTTNYAIPDCDDMPGVDQKTGTGNTKLELDAVRDHLDAKHLLGDDVVEDLHRGWFGARPDALDPNLWEGTTITLRKVDRIDADTGLQESGQVRFYAKWAGGYYGINAYDFQTLQPVNLVTAGVNGRPGEGVYGPTSTIPSGAIFYMEGVRPGKITLEWRFQKGEMDVKHEQTFSVETQQTVAEWREEIRYQIRLQTKVQTGAEVDLALYHTGQGFRRTDTWNQPVQWENSPRVRAIYYYYRQLFQQMPEKFMWTGMAKTAAAPIYAGMSDLTSWWQLQTQGLMGGVDGGLGTKFLVEGLLLGGQKAIFADKAWAHRAYTASGIGALHYVKDHEDDDATDFDAWDDLNAGIINQDQAAINTANRDLLLREQRDVVQRYYFDYATSIYMKQPPLQSWVGAVAVSENSNGLVNTGDWLSANSNKNPLPGGPKFRDVVPAGRIDDYDDRWTWTNNAANGMLQIWTGTATEAGIPNFNAAKRMAENNKTMYSAAAPYSFDPGGLIVE